MNISRGDEMVIGGRKGLFDAVSTRITLRSLSQQLPKPRTELLTPVASCACCSSSMASSNQPDDSVWADFDVCLHFYGCYLNAVHADIFRVIESSTQRQVQYRGQAQANHYWSQRREWRSSIEDREETGAYR